MRDCKAFPTGTLVRRCLKWLDQRIATAVRGCPSLFLRGTSIRIINVAGYRVHTHVQTFFTFSIAAHMYDRYLRVLGLLGMTSRLRIPRINFWILYVLTMMHTCTTRWCQALRQVRHLTGEVAELALH